MSISPKTRKMLWGRAASRCSLPECRIEVVMDVSETDDPTLVGEECHIVARETGGARGQSALTAEQRDLYGNLILLCCNHHKLVDDNPDVYPVDRLNELKSQHESWVRESLKSYDPRRQRDEEAYASIVDEWERRADLTEWDEWASSLVSNGQPRLAMIRVKELESLNEWLFRRVWPGRYPELEAAFENFRKVLSDLLQNLLDSGRKIGPASSQIVEVEKKYQNLSTWDPPRYKRLAKEFDFAVGVVQDLALELTRAANLVCAEIRTTLLHSYRLKEGLVVITAGPFSDMSYSTFRPRYGPGTSASNAYEGLKGFLRAREKRDVSLGSGEGPDDQVDED